MSLKVLLINPNTRNIGRIATTNPPMGLLYLASFIRKHGYHVSFVDADVDDLSIEDLLAKSEAFDVVGITMTTMQAVSGYMLAEAIKQRFSEKTIVVGGAHPSGMKERIFNDCNAIDYVIAGEGEQVFLDLLENLPFRENFLPLPKILHATVRLDGEEIPFPAIDLAEPINRYKPYYPENKGKQPFPVMSSRGCIFSCKYCGSNTVWGCKMTYRPPEKVMQEIRWLHAKYGVDEIYFLDDALNYNRPWVDELLDLIIDADLPIVFKGSIRANRGLIDEALAQKFKSAKFWALAMGVESGNQEVRDSIGKQLRTEDIERAFKILRKAGLKTIASFMIGHINDNEKTVKETIDFAVKLNPDQYDFPLCTPLPSTVLEMEAQQLNLITSRNWADYAMGKSVMRTLSLTNERLVELRDVAFSRMKRKKTVERMKRDPVFAVKVIARKMKRKLMGVKR